MRKLLGTACLLACLQPSALAGQTLFYNGSSPPTQELSEPDRQVLEAALRQFPPRGSLLDLTARVCLGDEFCFPRDLGDSIQFPDSTELLTLLRGKNFVTWNVGKLDVALATLSGAVFRALRGLRTPAELAATFPGVDRVVSVSAPAITASGQRALVYIESRCITGPCLDRSLILLERDARGWNAKQLK